MKWLPYQWRFLDDRSTRRVVNCGRQACSGRKGNNTSSSSTPGSGQSARTRASAQSQSRNLGLASGSPISSHSSQYLG